MKKILSLESLDSIYWKKSKANCGYITTRAVKNHSSSSVKVHQQPSQGKEAEKQSSCLKGFVAQVSYAGKALEKGKGSAAQENDSN